MTTLQIKNTESFPYVKPSAIAIGTIYAHLTTLVAASPVFGQTFQKAKNADTPEQFLKSREAAGAASVYGSSLLGSGVYTYSVAAILRLTGANTFTSAGVVGGLLFFISTVPSTVSSLVLDHRPFDQVLAKVAVGLVDSVGLAFTLTWWGLDDHHLPRSATFGS